MEPINYLAQVADPFAQSLQGLQLGAGMAELQQKQAAMVQQQQRQQLAAQEQAKFFTNPNPTMRDAARYASLLSPEQANAFRPFMEGISKEQQQGTLRRTGQLLSSLQLNPAIAVDRLKQESEAARNSGDAEEAALFDRLAAAVADPAQGPSVAFKALVQSVSAIPGAKDMLDAINKGMDTARDEGQAPAKLRQEIAAAKKAEVEARIAVETETDAVKKAEAMRKYEQAKAEKERVDAKYAEQVALADLKNKAATLGLTDAQRNEALARARKLSLESQKAVLELEALKAGTPDPAKAFQQEENLRKEYQARTKVYSELGTTYSNIESSSKAKSGPGDIALITGFMKMLDPGSVVRETEFATARDTAGLYTRLENSLKRAENGQFLQPKQREEFVNLAKQYLDSAQKKAGEDRKALGVVVRNYKLNADNVFGPATTATNDPNIVIVGGRNYTRPANFNDAQWAEYKKSVGAQ